MITGNECPYLYGTHNVCHNENYYMVLEIALLTLEMY